MIHLFNQDCMEGMKEFPDKFFEKRIDKLIPVWYE